MSTEMREIGRQVVYMLGLEQFVRSEHRIWIAVSPGGTMNKLPEYNDEPYVDIWFEPDAVDDAPHLWVHQQGGSDFREFKAVRLRNPTLEQVLAVFAEAVRYMEDYR